MEFSKRSCGLVVLGLAVALGFVTAALRAQTAGVARITGPGTIRAAAHSSVVAKFQISVQPGFHIQSNHPKLDYLIPSELSLVSANGIAVEKVAWPKATEHTFSFAPKQPLAVFEGTFAVPVTLRTGARGTATLHGRFRYQACNDELCKPPVTVPFSVTLQVR